MTTWFKFRSRLVLFLFCFFICTLKKKFRTYLFLNKNKNILFVLNIFLHQPNQTNLFPLPMFQNNKDQNKKKYQTALTYSKTKLESKVQVQPCPGRNLHLYHPSSGVGLPNPWPSPILSALLTKVFSLPSSLFKSFKQQLPFHTNLFKSL